MQQLNIINPAAVDGYLVRLAKGDPYLEGLLLRCLRRPLASEPRACDTVTLYPRHAPAWLTQSYFETRGPFYQFSHARADADWVVASSLCHIARWLRVAAAVGPLVVLKAERKIAHSRTRPLETLAHIAEQETRRLLGSHEEPHPAEDGSVVLDLEGGYAWVQLKSPAALRREGEAMRNCLARGGYGYLLADAQQTFFSLRDDEGRSHVTVHAMASAINEVKGRANTDPYPGFGWAIQALEKCIAPCNPSTGAATSGGSAVTGRKARSRINRPPAAIARRERVDRNCPVPCAAIYSARLPLRG